MRPDLHPRRLWVLGDVDEAGPGGKADEALLEADLLALVALELSQLRGPDGPEHRQPPPGRPPPPALRGSAAPPPRARPGRVAPWGGGGRAAVARPPAAPPLDEPGAPAPASRCSRPSPAMSFPASVGRPPACSISA